MIAHETEQNPASIAPLALRPSATIVNPASPQTQQMPDASSNGAGPSGRLIWFACVRLTLPCPVSSKHRAHWGDRLGSGDCEAWSRSSRRMFYRPIYDGSGPFDNIQLLRWLILWHLRASTGPANLADMDYRVWRYWRAPCIPLHSGWPIVQPFDMSRTRDKPARTSAAAPTRHRILCSVPS